jgi:hypothetical protein
MDNDVQVEIKNSTDDHQATCTHKFLIHNKGVKYVFYDFSRDKERPQKISRAKNYNNKSQLGTLFRNAFNNNGLYVESYTHNW